MKTGDKVWIVTEATFHRQLFSNMVAVSVNGSNNSVHLQMVKPEQVFAAKPESNEVLAKRIAELERQLVEAKAACGNWGEQPLAEANRKLAAIQAAWNEHAYDNNLDGWVALREAIEGKDK